ncbi:hypothetical protein E8E12_009193 [Didymella heteroderae]|uniref:F-box domain-containing protein n=1 Tax=Didymella heteroderae TaxID=1769908 RepID=A0A9P4WSF7_9PLEO|nr:hypothetical protein E8E12_009193 [Didymella heteroderae]
MPKAVCTSARSRASKATNDVTRRTRSGGKHSRHHLPPTGKTLVKRRTPKPPAFAFLARSQDIINADPNKQVRLFSLPRELLQQITSQLPLISIICLTLTCKEAAEAIGTQSWANYKKEKRWSMDRNGFIELLARDWGDVLDFCERCDTLHPPLPPPRSHRETKLTKWCLGQEAMIDYLPKDAAHGYNPVFVHIANAIGESQDFASKGATGPLVDTMSGSFTITKDDLTWSLDSSAQRIDGNLVVKHVHTFRSQTRKSLGQADLLNLPIRLCPHQSTTTTTPEPSIGLRSHWGGQGKIVEQNGRLLTHAIASVFPVSAQQAVDVTSLKPLTSSEQAQASAAEAGEDVYWRCRACPTKYRVRRSADAVTITSWHSFGRDLFHASKYWKMLVRRTGTTLGRDKRNDEWWSPSRTVPDFVCELE